MYPPLLKKRPLSMKWNPPFYEELRNFFIFRAKINLQRIQKITAGLTLPGLTNLSIGSAKRMTASILFFDLENFTTTTSYLSNEETLYILNVIIPSLIKIVKKWGGAIEKNTGDGVMAVLGTETRDDKKIASDAIECAMAMRYLMENDIQPFLMKNNFPLMNFRIGVDMEEILISRIGMKNINFLTVVGDAANRASKLQSLAPSNGICIGENLAQNLDKRLYEYLEEGKDSTWSWVKAKTNIPYRYFHYHFKFPNPKEWLSFKFN